MGVLLRGLRPNAARMLAACRQGFLDATDAADHLVRQGVPFREAHEAVGRAVQACQLRGCGLAELPLAAWKKIHPLAGPALYADLDLGAIVASRATFGGTAPRRMKAALAKAAARVKRSLA